MVIITSVRHFGHPWTSSRFAEKHVKPNLKKKLDHLYPKTKTPGIGDLRGSGARLGCPELLRQVVDNVKPTFHVYGHVHQVTTYTLALTRLHHFVQDAGVRSVGGTTFVNAATCDYMGSPCRKPVVLLLQRKGNI